MIEIEWERRLHQAGSDTGLAAAPDAVVVHARETSLVSLEPRDVAAARR